MKRRTLLAFMLDRPGVLNKVSMLIRRKMYNVDTLTVCSSRIKGISRMTITLREDDPGKVEQVMTQLATLVEVISVKELDTNNSYWREVAIVKLEVEAARLSEFQDRYNFEVLDKKSEDMHILQVAGATGHIDGFLDEIGRENIIEIARTGVSAMEK
jgi:acetolactate synthase-1/3 small subunit